MPRSCSLLAGLVAAALLAGCNSGGVQEKVIVIEKKGDSLTPARTVLKRYADGQPMASEVTGFPKMIEDVRAAAPEKADVLEKGLKEIERASPAARAGLARSLLAKLGPEK
jgi:hypothetical protein